MSELYNEDCLIGIKKVKDNSVDLVFCDLPYGCTGCEWDNKIDLNELSKELWRVAKEETPIVFTATLHFGLEIIDAMGRGNLKYEMIWDKGHSTTPFLAKVRPMKRHELVLVFYKKQPKIYKRKIEEYHDKFTTIPARDKQGVFNHKESWDTEGNVKKTYEKKLPTSVLNIKNCSKKLNRTQKPVEIIEFFIQYYTDEGGLVLDPTFGSGSSAVACKNQNRKFVGFELNEDQYKSAVKRLN